MVFLCHQLAFVFVMALFKTARCFVTPDLDFRGEGEDDGEMETLIISLEMGKGRHPLHKFSPLSFIGSKVVANGLINATDCVSDKILFSNLVNPCTSIAPRDVVDTWTRQKNQKSS